MNRSVDGQTPPVSLTLNHLPFHGRQGRFAPMRVPLTKRCEIPWFGVQNVTGRVRALTYRYRFQASLKIPVFINRYF